MTGIKLNTLLMFELNYVAYGLLFGFRYDLYYGYKNGSVRNTCLNFYIFNFN